jgi:hypothetical protein
MRHHLHMELLYPPAGRWGGQRPSSARGRRPFPAMSKQAQSPQGAPQKLGPTPTHAGPAKEGGGRPSGTEANRVAEQRHRHEPRGHCSLTGHGRNPHRVLILHLLSELLQNMEWDAENGVWKGNKAWGSEEVIPDPLWIFGYGSLCWKTDFAFASRCSGVVRGWRRLFWQASMDHRGTPKFPGRTVTMVQDEGLAALGNWHAYALTNTPLTPTLP